MYVLVNQLFHLFIEYFENDYLPFAPVSFYILSIFENLLKNFKRILNGIVMWASIAAWDFATKLLIISNDSCKTSSINEVNFPANFAVLL